MIQKLYAQVDNRWSSQILGFNTDPAFDIGNYGCLVTAYANLLCAVTGNMQYTPAYVNDYMKQHQGFMPDSGLFRWPIAGGLGHVSDHGESTDLAGVNRWLADPPNFAILEVRAKTKENVRIQHFVMAPYADKIVDSEDGLLKSIGTYPFVNAHLYRATDPVNVPPAPAPAQPKTTGWAKVTAKIDGRPTYLNLRSRPSDKATIGKGQDGNGHVIYSMPYGAEFEFINVVDADADSTIKGPWLETRRKNYVLAAATDYKA